MTHRNLAALAIVFGLTVTALAPAAIAQPTTAQQLHLQARATNLNGTFVSGEWIVDVSYNNNTYSYSGRNTSGSSISLSGATVRRDGEKRIYTWNNGGTRYQVVWQSKDPDFIRVRVTTPQGREVLNRLMRRAEGDGC
jgi:hypothetical protein